MAWSYEWKVSDPTDANQMSSIDDFVVRNHSAVAERLTGMVYGFVEGGEADDTLYGFKSARFVSQGSNATAVAGSIILFGKEIDGKSKLFAIVENSEVLLVAGVKTHIRASKSADQNFGGLTLDNPTIVTFNTEDYDVTSEFAGNTFTVVTTGTYLVMLELKYYCVYVTGAGGDTLHIYKNGASLYSLSAITLAAGETKYITFSQILLLTAGDTVDIRIGRPSSDWVSIVRAAGSSLTIQQIL